jgi:hypothetical protein
MVLGEPVLDLNGRILAKKGDCLSADLLARIHAAGASDLLVAERTQTIEDVSHAATTPKQNDAEIANIVRKKLDFRFRGHQGNPIMQTIRTLAEKQLIQAKLSQLTH